MGTSLTMIDRHYRHLARVGPEHAIRLLHAFTASEPASVHCVWWMAPTSSVVSTEDPSAA